MPGPELRVTQGHRVQVTLVNNLPEWTTLHWHGLQLPNAADGVAQATADVLVPIVLDEHPGMREGRAQLIHTTINYQGVATPFEMGTRSGNMPE